MAVTYEKLWKLLQEKNMKKLRCSEKPELAAIFLLGWEETNIFQWRAWKRYAEYCIAAQMIFWIL